MPDAGLTDLQRTRSLAALAEITRPTSVGNFLHRVDAKDGSYSLVFECLLDGYPGWQWNVSLAEVDGDEPTVLEAELLPTEGALVAPDWVPWSQRLAEYLEAQKQAGIDEEAALAAMQAAAAADEDELESFDEEDESDEDESDEDESDEDESEDDDDDDDEDDDDDDSDGDSDDEDEGEHDDSELV